MQEADCAGDKREGGLTGSFLDAGGGAVLDAALNGARNRGGTMAGYEYKVLPAPLRGDKERGLKSGAERFAHALGALMNELAEEGWEYWRAETLPAEERTGLASKTTVYHNLLVFRRAVGAEGEGPGGGGVDATEEAGPLALSRAEAEVLRARERRARLLSAHAPEGRAPRLGPAGEESA